MKAEDTVMSAEELETIIQQVIDESMTYPLSERPSISIRDIVAKAQAEVAFKAGEESQREKIFNFIETRAHIVETSRLVICQFTVTIDEWQSLKEGV